MARGKKRGEKTESAREGALPKAVVPALIGAYLLLILLILWHGYQIKQSAGGGDGSSFLIWYGGVLLVALSGFGLLIYLLRRGADHLAALASERDQLRERIQNQNLVDSQTGLPNRLLLEERLNHKISDARRGGLRFMLMLVRINDFKRINKVLGYEVGDAVLRHLAKSLVDGLRETDTVARFDGDAFAVLADISEKNQAEIIARKVQDAVGKTIDVGDSPVTVTAAIGVAVFPEQGNDAQMLIENADKAVTRARQVGGHAIVFSEEDTASGVDRLALLTGIKEAMREGHLDMVFQPKLALVSPEAHSFEALLRWHHPEYGLLPSDMYIPLVEQTRHILDLTRWTIESCFATQKELMKTGVEATIAINISARVLDDNSFPIWVERMVAQYGLQPSHVRFELTESAIMQDSERALQVLLQLAAIGVGLSVDDFGVGHSSLAYLSRLAVDELKVDKSFVINMLKWESDRTIVRATINLAHDLGLNVVAEGVENLQQATMLREMECDMLQGYYVSRPLSRAQLLKWAASRAA